MSGGSRASEGSLRKGDIKAAVYAAMAQAYDEASIGGTIPADARGMGYADRRVSGLGDRLRLDYFLKRLLDSYLQDHPDETADWDVVRDARGTLREPHGFEEVPLGTIAVRDYRLRNLGDVPEDDDDLELPLWVPTHGPLNRFGAIFYVEKEGLLGAINAADIPRRYDLAIASCKGYSVKAARRLLRELRDVYGVKVLVARDFDKAGFGIADTLGDGFIDIGLRLSDVEDPRWGLAGMSESVTYDADPRSNLRLRGATEEEIAYLCRNQRPDGMWEGRRVELNALVGSVFTEWLETRLQEAGVEKVVPDVETLKWAYRRAYERTQINRAINEAREQAARAAAEVEVPRDIVTLVTTALEQRPDLAWDDVVAGLVGRA